MNVGLDAAILMNPRVWEATGHVSTFNDPMVDCKACKARHRADELIKHEYPDVDVDAMDFEQMDEFMKTNKMTCPVCGKSDFTPIRKFNMMFKTHIGVTEDASSAVYLRPETAQGVFVNFKNVQRTCRKKIPFGVCNAGKSFRNEITPGNFDSDFKVDIPSYGKGGGDLTDWARVDGDAYCWVTLYDIPYCYSLSKKTYSYIGPIDTSLTIVPVIRITSYIES